MKRVLLGVAVVAAGGLLVVLMREDISEALLVRALPARGKPFAGFILASARKWRLDPWKLAGVLARESGFGAYLQPPTPAGKGDNGHGHGLAQIDDRTWGAWLASRDWTDAATNIDKGAEILSTELARFGGDYSKALAAYNAGPANVRRAVSQGKHPDTVTTGKDYSSNVLDRARVFQQKALA